MREKNKHKHADIGWGKSRKGAQQIPQFQSQEEAMAYLRANPPSPAGIVGSLVIILGFTALILSPLILRTYQANLVKTGDEAFKTSRFEEAETLYQKSLNIPLSNNADTVHEKINLTRLYEEKYDLAAGQLKELIVRHLARLEEANSSRRSGHSSRYSPYAEGLKLRYMVANYTQVLALQGKLNEIRPFQTQVWEQAFSSCKRDRVRLQIEKNILDHTQGSLRNRGYDAEADALREKKLAIQDMPQSVQEQKNIELINSLMPPKPYDSPIFCQDAMRN
jgi:hypothetical protein